MRKFVVVVAMVGSLLTAAFAQQQMNLNIDRAPGPGARTTTERISPPEPTAQERKRGLELLSAVEGPVRGMDGATQALALVTMAKGYASVDKKKALSLLDDAMSSVRDAQFQFTEQAMIARTKSGIQRDIVQAMLPLDEAHVEKLLTEADPEMQRVVLSQLLQHYEETKQDDKAIDAIEQISRSSEMPYREAAAVMGRMGPEQSAELRTLFTEAMNSYDLHDDPSKMRTSGFPDLIVKFHSKLPAELTRQAVDLVLAHARQADEKAAEKGNKPSIGVGSSKGAAQFSSVFDFELFQLEPTIRSVDPAYADRLLKEHRDAQLFLAKYPTGLSALGDDSSPNGMGMMMSMSNGDGGPRGQKGGGPQGPSPLDMQRMQKIQEDAEAHPQDALASVPTLSDPQMQKEAYLGIATVTAKKNSSVSRSALRKALDLTSKLQSEEQVRTANSAAATYLTMGDLESAKSTLEKAIALGDQIYKQDTNADDPNQAPRWYWPSMAAWRSSMEIATRTDQRWAMSLLKGISDDDIRALNQLAIASQLLHITPKMVQIMTFHKDGARMMMIDARED